MEGKALSTVTAILSAYQVKAPEQVAQFLDVWVVFNVVVQIIVRFGKSGGDGVRVLGPRFAFPVSIGIQQSDH